MKKSVTIQKMLEAFKDFQDLYNVNYFTKEQAINTLKDLKSPHYVYLVTFLIRFKYLNVVESRGKDSLYTFSAKIHEEDLERLLDYISLRKAYPERRFDISIMETPDFQYILDNGEWPEKVRKEEIEGVKNKIPSHSLTEAEAVEMLKSLGYKLQKPVIVTQYEEI